MEHLPASVPLAASPAAAAPAAPECERQLEKESLALVLVLSESGKKEPVDAVSAAVAAVTGAVSGAGHAVSAAVAAVEDGEITVTLTGILHAAVG